MQTKQDVSLLQQATGKKWMHSDRNWYFSIGISIRLFTSCIRVTPKSIPSKRPYSIWFIKDSRNLSPSYNVIKQAEIYLPDYDPP